MGFETQYEWHFFAHRKVGQNPVTFEFHKINLRLVVYEAQNFPTQVDYSGVNTDLLSVYTLCREQLADLGDHCQLVLETEFDAIFL